MSDPNLIPTIIMLGLTAYSLAEYFNYTGARELLKGGNKLSKIRKVFPISYTALHLNGYFERRK